MTDYGSQAQYSGHLICICPLSGLCYTHNNTRPDTITEYELASLYIEQASLVFNVLTLLTTLLFSYLVGMYFISKRLSVVLFWMLNALFVLVSFFLSAALFANGERTVSIGQELLRRMALEGSQIGWLSHNIMPDNAPQVMRTFFLFAIVLAIAFAIVRRRDGKK